MPLTIIHGCITRISDRNTIVMMDKEELEKLLNEIAKFKQNIIVIEDPEAGAWYISALRVVVYLNVKDAKLAYMKQLARRRATVIQ